MSDEKEEDRLIEVVTESMQSVDDKVNDSFFARKKSKYKEKKAEKLKKIEENSLSPEENKKVEEKLKELDSEVKSANSKKKKITNIIFFIFNILLVVAILLWNILGSDDFTPLSLVGINFTFVLIVVFILGVILFLDVASTHRMIYRKTLRSRWSTSYKSTALLRYYDSITPFASGGQAFMVAYLTGRDVPATTALSIPITKLIFQQIVWVCVCFVCLITSLVNGMSTFVSLTSIVGFILGFLMVSIIMFLSLSKSFGKKVVAWVLKLACKMHIVKDYEKKYNSVMKFVEDYQAIMKEYSKAKWDIVYMLAIYLVRQILYYSIPFFIFCIFKGYEPSLYGTFFMYTALIELSSSFIPLPGGTGMNEITFTVIFNTYLQGETFWALLLWRFCSYYIYLLQGISVLTYDTVYGNRKYRWVQKRNCLRAESQEFRRTQIEMFRTERNKRRKKEKTIKSLNK